MKTKKRKAREQIGRMIYEYFNALNIKCTAVYLGYQWNFFEIDIENESCFANDEIAKAIRGLMLVTGIIVTNRKVPRHFKPLWSEEKESKYIKSLCKTQEPWKTKI